MISNKKATLLKMLVLGSADFDEWNQIKAEVVEMWETVKSAQQFNLKTSKGLVRTY